MKPKQIKVIEKNKLFFKWENDTESYIDLKYLRDECPCASCKGETVLLKTYIPAKPANDAPENFVIKSIQQVGGYAIQILWAPSPSQRSSSVFARSIFHDGQGLAATWMESRNSSL